jgi:hypothetical protein
MQPRSVRVKLCDQPFDAFDLSWVSRRTQQLECAQPVCLFLRTTDTCPNARLRSWFGLCRAARVSLPLPSNRQQAVAKAPCPRSSLPDPPSGGSGVPGRDIPLVCWSLRNYPRDLTRATSGDALCSKRGPATNSKGTRAIDNRHVRFGSKADIALVPRHVRFTPKSGHQNSARITLGEATPAASRYSPRSAAPLAGVRRAWLQSAFSFRFP